MSDPCQFPTSAPASVAAAAAVVAAAHLHDLEPVHDGLDRGHAVNVRVEDGLIGGGNFLHAPREHVQHEPVCSDKNTGAKGGRGGEDKKRERESNG